MSPLGSGPECVHLHPPSPSTHARPGGEREIIQTQCRPLADRSDSIHASYNMLQTEVGMAGKMQTEYQLSFYA